MREPLVTVIIPARNEGPFIGAALDSVLDQTYSRLEVIVVDDQSDDNTVEICRGFHDGRVSVVEKGNLPLGPAASRNLGADLATGEFLANQDADDVSEPFRIERQLTAALVEPGRRVVGCCVREIFSGRERVLRMPETHGEISAGFCRRFNRATFVAGTIFAPVALFRKIRNRPWLRYHEDWDQLVRLHESGSAEFYNCQDVLYNYYRRDSLPIANFEWEFFNILVRASQQRRSAGLCDFESVQDFQRFIGESFFRRLKWAALGTGIGIRRRISRF